MHAARPSLFRGAPKIRQSGRLFPALPKKRRLRPAKVDLSDDGSHTARPTATFAAISSQAQPPHCLGAGCEPPRRGNDYYLSLIHTAIVRRALALLPHQVCTPVSRSGWLGAGGVRMRRALNWREAASLWRRFCGSAQPRATHAITTFKYSFSLFLEVTFPVPFNSPVKHGTPVAGRHLTRIGAP